MLHNRSQPADVLFLPVALRVVTTVLLFGLLAEWVLALEAFNHWTQLYRMGPLIAVIGFTLAIGITLPVWWLSLLLNGMMCTTGVMWLFYSGTDPVSWPSRLISSLIEDGRTVVHGSGLLSGELRTLLLFSGLSTLASAYQALIWSRHWGPGLAAMTISYLLAVHWLTGADVYAGVMRAAFEGLLLTALITYFRAVRGYGSGALRAVPVELLKAWPLRWWASGLACAAMLLAAGYGASVDKPRQEVSAVWPAGWVKAAQWELAAWSVKKEGASSLAGNSAAGPLTAITGYGMDGSRLGAPLTIDDTVVFTGVSPVTAYWRGETADTYDGRRWTQSVSEKVLMPVGDHEIEPIDWEQQAGSGRRMIRQSVVMARPMSGLPLFAGGSEGKVVRLTATGPERTLQTYSSDALAGALFPPGDDLKIASYTIESELIEPEWLEDMNTGSGGRDPQEIMETYLQLPHSLPNRVKELSDQIAAKAGDSRLAKTHAIENYLRSSYAYTLEDTQVPDDHTDFVDHFLFGQQKGYCVHFSTAMVVMLRTQGIPARWVKGFVPGEAESLQDSNLGLGRLDSEAMQTERRYIVRNRDAHAWVEVYFPEAGWVPFDPTPGYDGEGSAAAASAAAAGQDAVAGGTAAGAGAASGLGADATGARSLGGFAGRAYAQLKAAALQAAEALPRGAEALAERVLGAGGRLAAAAADPAARLRAGIAAGAAMLACAALAAAWRSRARIALALALRRYGRAYASGRETRVRFLAVAAACWRLLYRLHGERPPAMTAREYAGSLKLPADASRRLADFLRWDEQARFGSEWPPLPPDKLAATIGPFLNAGKLPGNESVSSS